MAEPDEDRLTEEELLEEVRLARSRFVDQAHDFGEGLGVILDPLKSVRRNPLGGMVASMATGVILGVLRPKNGSERAASNPRPAARAAGVLDFVWSSLPLIVPVLQGLVARRRG